MRSHQARAKLIKHVHSNNTVAHLVMGTLSSQERHYVLGIKQASWGYEDLVNVPIAEATGTKSRKHIIFGTYPVKILNAANVFYNEVLERHPNEPEAQTLIQRRLRAMTDRLSLLPNENLSEQSEAQRVQEEYDELVKLASFLVQHDLRPLGDYEATATLLGW